MIHHSFVITGLPELNHNQSNKAKVKAKFRDGIFFCKTTPVSINVAFDYVCPENFFPGAFKDCLFQFNAFFCENVWEFTSKYESLYLNLFINFTFF